MRPVAAQPLPGNLLELINSIAMATEKRLLPGTTITVPSPTDIDLAAASLWNVACVMHNQTTDPLTPV